MKIRLLVLSLFASSLVFADDIKQLAPTVVTATRVETNSFDLPVSIDVVGSESIHDGQAEMNLSESLIRVPGLTAQNRTQMAQDPQIATRGFGARSAFGVRGVRIIEDGISLSMPDGIGQPGNVDLANVKSIEVMRGPFSSLYGSSSGGVINLITKDAPKTPELNFGFMGGSYGTTKETIGASGTFKDFQYILNADRFDTDGYRDHSSAWKEQQTAKIKFNISDSTKLTVIANLFKSESEDPLGSARNAGFDLTKYTQYYRGGDPVSVTSTVQPQEASSNAYYSAFSNPKAAPDAAILANTRVARENTQIGLILDQKINDRNQFKLTASAGQRDNLQYLALPLSYGYATTADSNSYRSYSNIYNSLANAQAATDPSKGRASSIKRDFWNSDLNWTNTGELLSKKYSLTAGLAYGWMNDRRKDINASGGEMLSTDSSLYCGTCSNLTTYAQSLTNYKVNMNRDENDTAYNLDQYMQAKLTLTNSSDLHAGLRHSYVNMRFKSNIPTNTSNPAINMNGVATFERTTPVIGFVYKANPYLNVYANYGEGFETPTLIEMAYNSSTNATGPNLTLKPSYSDNYEVGFKSLMGNTSLNAALFKVISHDEIIVSANSAYSVYSNAQKTSRTGLELSAESKFANNFNLYGAYTFIDAKFDSQYTSGVGGFNGGGGTVNAGNTIPGTYRQQLYLESSWKYPELNFKTALEGRLNTKVYIDDINSAAAPGYGILNLRAGFEQNTSGWKFTEFARVENILDKNYIGSVRVNDNNNRNYEPAAGRNYLVGINASYQFK
jgi:iron complex outermembrane receptor protein